MEHIHKLIVTSATYRQSSKVAASAFEADPQNRLLSRGPRFRLSAETVRDNRAGRQRNLLAESGRAARLSSAARGHLASRRPQRAQIPDIARRRSLSPRDLRGVAVQCGAVRELRQLRCAGSVVLRRPASPHQHAAAGLDAAQRSGLRRNGHGVGSPHAAGPRGIMQRVDYGFRRRLGDSPPIGVPAFGGGLPPGIAADFQAVPPGGRQLLEGYNSPTGHAAEEMAAWFVVANILLNLDEMITKG